MTVKDNVLKAVDAIHAKAPGFEAKIGIILGSGLGPLADDVEEAVGIPYENIPGFPISKVAGHEGKLILGKLSGVPVACLKGRVHMYEGTPLEAIKMMIRTLKFLGCHALIITNAAGSLHLEIGPGEISMIYDHINIHQDSPLVGPNDDEFGPRFVSMNDAYDPNLRQLFSAAARDADIDLHTGVYTACLGPCFETPAEIRMFQRLGVDLTGMSTIPEVIVARHCGLKVAAFSAVVNFGAGMSETPPSHKETLHYGNIASTNLCALVKMFLKNNAAELNKATPA